MTITKSKAAHEDHCEEVRRGRRAAAGAMRKRGDERAVILDEARNRIESSGYAGNQYGERGANRAGVSTKTCIGIPTKAARW